MEPVTPPDAMPEQPDNETPSPASTVTEREDRRATVWDGMLSGKSYRVLAAELGISRQTVLRDVKVLRRRWVTIAERYDDHARLDLARIEKLIATLWPVALTGGKGGNPDKFAIDRIGMLLDRKAKLLGYDRPARAEIKHTVEHTSTLDLAIEELLAEFPRQPEALEPPSVNGNGD